jgi:DNA polymerase (family 10)
MVVDISQIADFFSQIADLLELHGENSFKVNSYRNVSLKLNYLHDANHKNYSSEQAIQQLKLSKGMTELFVEIASTGQSSFLNNLIDNTPSGLIDLLQLRGLGPKKVHLLWKSIGVTNIDLLEEACLTGKISTVKGFGLKSQEAIISSLKFLKENKGKVHYYLGNEYADMVKNDLVSRFPGLLVSVTGELRRKLEVINDISFLIGTNQRIEVLHYLDSLSYLLKFKNISGPFSWRGLLVGANLKIEFVLTNPNDFYKNLIIYTGCQAHLQLNVNATTLGQLAHEVTFSSEEEFYKKIGFHFVPPELREGIFEKPMFAISNDKPSLIDYEDLCGPIHCHTTYSDGKNTIKEMSEECINLGYKYIGITDHSQSAAYAGGLNEERIKQQHREIDMLNGALYPFKIFKGIECDIKMDGSLDYDESVLELFDFVIVSIHTGLQMDKASATHRLIKAIENPFTTMLGHLTGRLLLRRSGYEIDHIAVIDACAEHNVIIELNSNPMRLEIDWRWLDYAKKKKVPISINPDAHSTIGIQDMRYGINCARKGGLIKNEIFNALNASEVSNYFNNRKKANPYGKNRQG